MMATTTVLTHSASNDDQVQFDTLAAAYRQIGRSESVQPARLVIRGRDEFNYHGKLLKSITIDELHRPQDTTTYLEIATVKLESAYDVLLSLFRIPSDMTPNTRSTVWASKGLAELLKNMFMALDFVNKRGVQHNDVNLHNILIRDSKPILTGFESATVYKESDLHRIKHIAPVHGPKVTVGRDARDLVWFLNDTGFLSPPERFSWADKHCALFIKTLRTKLEVVYGNLSTMERQIPDACNGTEYQIIHPKPYHPTAGGVAALITESML
jgi:hypothetical protein